MMIALTAGHAWQHMNRSFGVLRSLLLMSSGHGTLEVVQEPLGLQFPSTRRAQRMMRCGRLSAW